MRGSRTSPAAVLLRCPCCAYARRHAMQVVAAVHRPVSNMQACWMEAPATPYMPASAVHCRHVVFPIICRRVSSLAWPLFMKHSKGRSHHSRNIRQSLRSHWVMLLTICSWPLCDGQAACDLRAPLASLLSLPAICGCRRVMTGC